MGPRNQTLALITVILLSIPLAQAVEVEKGVEFVTPGGNSKIDFGHNQTFDNITVREESASFGTFYLSIDHLGESMLNATVWNRSFANVLNTPTLKIETHGGGGEAVFTAGQAQKNKEYRVERDNTTITEMRATSGGRISWDTENLALPHNFTATLLLGLENVTVQFTGSFDHPRDTAVIDGEENPSEGTYSDVGFGYASVELGGKVAGIVPAGSFLQLEFHNLSGDYRFDQTQEGDGNQFLIPFTEGDHGVIEDRENVIQGSLFGPGNFLGYPSPNFAYQLSEEKTVRLTLGYDNVILQGFNGTLSEGTYSIVIQNRGEEDGQRKVRILAR